MWYLSVDMQAFVAMSVVLYFVRRRPWGQVAVLTGLLLLLTWWRMHVTELEPVLNVLLRTTARMDAFVAGLLLGAVLSLWRPQRLPRWVGVLATVALVPLLWLCSDDERFLHWGVTLLELDLAVLLAAIVLGPQRAVPRALRPATFLGRHSLPLYVWHYPAVAAVGARTGDWAWAPRAVVALLVTAALCVATHYLLERHVARLLVHPFWARLRPREDVSPAADPRQQDLRVDDLSLPTGRR
jgi:peptidoglycan/LPS O-acetylase OafA/YrhL